MSTGGWLDASIPGMKYRLLQPAGYDPAQTYPAVIYLHELGRGTDPTDLNREINGWFNPGVVRDAHPCFVIVPLLDQTADRSGVTINFGGVSQAVTNGRDLVLQVISKATSDYPAIDKTRLILTGSSLGGLGTWELICYRPDLFAAAMPLAGANYWRDPKAMAQALKDKPIWAIHGASDTSVPLTWDRAFAAATKAIGGLPKYSEDPGHGHDVWDYWYPRTDLWDWAFAQRLGGAVSDTTPTPPKPAGGPPSAEDTIIQPGGTITDAGGNAWTITADGQVAINGVADTSTKGVTQLAWCDGVLWQCNQAGNWYPRSGSGWGAATTTNPVTGLAPPPPTPAPPAAGGFSIRNGWVVDAAGNVVLAQGINLNDWQMNTAVTNDACQPLLTWFPNLNIVRVACRQYSDPSYYQPFVRRMTALQKFVWLEDHTSISGGPYTGSQLDAECKWYAALAAAFKDNPYVWFGCLNEPGKQVGLPAIWAQQVEIYKAIRGTGSRAIIWLQVPSGGAPGKVGVQGRGFDGSGPMTSSAKGMFNVGTDFHFYAYGAKYASDAATIQSYLEGSVAGGYGIAACKSIQSDDGEMPVLIGEFGPSTTGNLPDDAGGVTLDNLVAASIGKLTTGWVAWALDAGGSSDKLVSGGQLTTYGKQIAALMKPLPAIPAPPPTQPANPPPSGTPALQPRPARAGAINRTQDFLGVLGVPNYVHTAGAMQIPAQYMADITALGVRLVRFDLEPGSTMSAGRLALAQAIVAAGIKIIAIPMWVGGSGPPYKLVLADILAQLRQIHQLGSGGNLYAIEGANEPSNYRYLYNGAEGGGSPGSDHTPIGHYMQDLYAAVRADTVLRGVPVTGVTNAYGENPNCGLQWNIIPPGAGATFPDGTQFGDMLGIHVYPEFYQGGMSQVSLPSGDAAQIAMYGDHVHTSTKGYAGYASTVEAMAQPWVCTEYNFHSGTGKGHLPDALKARNVLTGLLSMWAQGASALIVHSVYEEQDGYGIYSAARVPTPLVAAWRNLAAILNDSGATRGTFTPQPYDVKVGNLPATARYQRFRKSTGECVVVFWNNVNNYDGTNVIPITPAAVTGAFPGPGTIKTFNPLLSAAALTITPNATTGLVLLADMPVAVEWTPASGATGAPPDGSGQPQPPAVTPPAPPPPTPPPGTPSARFSAPFSSLACISPNGSATTWMCGLGYGGDARRSLKWNSEGEYYWDIGGAYSAYAVDANGGLIITADRATIANPMGLPFNSGALSSCTVANGMPAAGVQTGLTYFYAEMLARLPAGRGLFPAFWWEPLAGGDGEVDAMEALGHDLTSIYCTVHYSATDTVQIQALDPSATAISARQVKVTVSDYSKTAHRYGVDKQPDFTTWYVDRKPVARIPTPAAAKRPGYLLVNLAVGQAGSWPGAPDTSTVFPARMGPLTIDIWPNVGAAGTPDLAPVIAQVGAMQTSFDTIGQQLAADIAALKAALTKLQQSS